jgi:hypothetical protein
MKNVLVELNTTPLAGHKTSLNDNSPQSIRCGDELSDGLLVFFKKHSLSTASWTT